MPDNPLEARVYYWLDLPKGTKFYSRDMGLGFLRQDLQAVRDSIRYSLEMWNELPEILVRVFNDHLGQWNGGPDKRLQAWMMKHNFASQNRIACPQCNGKPPPQGLQHTWKWCRCAGTGRVDEYKYTGRHRP